MTTPDRSSSAPGRPGRPRLGRPVAVALAVAAVVVPLALGALGGRALAGQAGRPGWPALPGNGPVTVSPGAATGQTVQRAQPTGRDGIGLAAGPLVPNPGGRPDLTADPAALVTGSPRVAPGPASTTGFDEDDGDGIPGLPDDPATEPGATPSASGTTTPTPSATSVPTLVAPATIDATAATAGAGRTPGASGPVDLSRVQPHPDAFNDPCLRIPTPSGCPHGVEGTVLGDAIAPELRLLWAGEIRRTDVYAGECARQFATSAIDWNRDSVFAAVVNLPTTGTLRLQLFHPRSLYWGGPPRPGPLVAGTVTSSAELIDAWTRSFAAGARTPTVPLCLKVPQATMDANRDGCLATWTGSWWDCRSIMDLSLEPGCSSSTTDPICNQLAAMLGWEVPRGVRGPLRFEYSYDPQWKGYDTQLGGEPVTGDDLRRRVQLIGVDPLNLEVHVPLFSRGLAEADVTVEPSSDGWVVSRGVVNENQLVVAAGYPMGTDCRDADPTTASTILPVTRQAHRTRYVSPDPAKPVLREGVVNLTMPRLAADEGVAVCVYWYALPTRSYDGPTVTAIERHVVVPPGRSVTQVRVVGSSRGAGVPNPDTWTWQWIGNRPLTQSCGFDSARPAPTLRPLGDDGLLCQIDSSTYVFEPTDAELYAGLVASPEISGRVRLPIDNRGCDGACGGDRVSRLTLSDGSWVDLSVRRTPLESEPLLPGGRLVGGRADSWLIDPEPPVSIIPALRPRIAGPFPSLDVMSVRLSQDASDPQHVMRLDWEADRSVLVTFSASSLAADLAVGPCPTTWTDTREPRASGSVTLPGLCAGNGYRFAVTLTDPSTGKRTRYDVAGAASTADQRVVSLRLEGRTASPAVPADYGYDWTLSLARTPAPRWAVFTSLDARFGSNLLVDRSGASGACRPVGDAVAAGSSHPEFLGQLLAAVEYTAYVYDNASCSGTPQVVSVASYKVTHWLGASPQTVALTASDGSTATLTVRRST